MKRVLVFITDLLLPSNFSTCLASKANSASSIDYRACVFFLFTPHTIRSTKQQNASGKLFRLFARTHGHVTHSYGVCVAQCICCSFMIGPAITPGQHQRVSSRWFARRNFCLGAWKDKSWIGVKYWGKWKKLKANCRKFNSLPLSFNRVRAKTKNKELKEKCVKPNCSDLPTVIAVNFACQPTFEPTQLKTKSS